MSNIVIGALIRQIEALAKLGGPVAKVPEAPKCDTTAIEGIERLLGVEPNFQSTDKFDPLLNIGAGVVLNEKGCEPSPLSPQTIADTLDLAEPDIENFRQEFTTALSAMQGAGMSAGAQCESLCHIVRYFGSALPAASFSTSGIVLSQGTSLAAHAQLVAAVADIVSKGSSDSELAFVRLEFTGIQSYLYAFTRRSQDYEGGGIAKRLRARSFLISMVVDLISREILRTFDLTLCNRLVCAGGKVDLLLPPDADMSKMRSLVATGLERTFGAQIGMVASKIEVKIADLNDASAIWSKLAPVVRNNRRQQDRDRLSSSEFWTPAAEPTITEGDERKLGELLPKAACLCFAPARCSSNSLDFELSLDGFGTKAFVSTDESTDAGPNGVVLHLSNPRQVLQQSTSQSAKGFKLLANWVPLKNDRVADFEELSKQSKGAERLAALRMDVDRLGSIFGTGLGRQASISRMMTLSERVDLFFSGVLGTIMTKEPASGGLDRMFYTVYAGGDDLFLVGPWNAILDLAPKVVQEFESYNGGNPAITLSAGVAFMKPHTPINYVAHRAGEAEETAKVEGRDRICTFGTTVGWPELGSLLEMGKRLAADDRIATGFIRTIRNLRTTYFKKGDPMWVPLFYYTYGRNVSHEARQDLQLEKELVQDETFRSVLIATDTALLLRRD